MKQTEAPGSVAGMYVDENPGGSPPTQGTLLVAEDRNAIQDELIHLIQHAGLSPSGGDLTQIRQAVQALTEALIAAHAGLEAAGVHGSTAAATASKAMHRDAAGRSKVAAPSASDDIARKAEADAVQTNLTTHEGVQAAGVHGSTAAATASKLVHRDAAGRTKFAAPSASDDAAIKSTVDAVQTNLTTHEGVQAAGVHGSTVAATANKAVHRDAAGRTQMVAPSAAADVAIKSTVDDHAALAAAGVHGSTSAATASKLVHRDANARTKFAAPAASDDAAIKSTVDAVQTNLTTHEGVQAAGVHGSTSAATAGKLMVRDGAGRTKVAPPLADDDVARKDTVDAITSDCVKLTGDQTIEGKKTFSARVKGKGFFSSYIEGSNRTQNDVFDILNAYIPNTGDEILLTGGFTTPDPYTPTPYIVTRAYRSASNQVQIFAINTMGVASPFLTLTCTDGNATVVMHSARITF